MSGARTAEVIVVGGGPAGSVLAWDLARKGVRVLVLERARMPREKVCGDFVDPRGLEVLGAMGALGELVRSRSCAVARTSMFVEWERRYDGPIPFYEGGGGERGGGALRGATIPRVELDAAMLAAAARAGALIEDETAVGEVVASAGGVEVSAQRRGRSVTHRAAAIVGADGVNSTVARSLGIAAADRLRTVVAQRAYASGYSGAAPGTNEIFFERCLFPGYGWIFPAAGGRVNVGVGMLAATRHKLGVNVPALFAQFLERLRLRHPGARELELTSKPTGGSVRTYAAVGRNHFDGGLLVGDAGSFANPMTGEGITPAMESALLATPALCSALAAGEASAARLAPYERAFRCHFDPSMAFLSLTATMLRNEHFARPWLKAFARGCEMAQQDPDFARTSGSFFGGIEIRPFAIIGQVFARSLGDALLAVPRSLTGSPAGGPSPADLLEWHAAAARSALSDPREHLRWTADVRTEWARLLAAGSTGGDPRALGAPGL